jgi:hypothetical protein
MALRRPTGAERTSIAVADLFMFALRVAYETGAAIAIARILVHVVPCKNGAQLFVQEM